jgi:hypothetical protein
MTSHRAPGDFGERVAAVYLEAPGQTYSDRAAVDDGRGAAAPR